MQASVTTPSKAAGSPLSPAARAALLRRVGRALSRHERERVCCDGVTRQQFDTLHSLAETGGATTSEVARRFGIDLSTASRNLAVLEREGLVRRRTGAKDSRSVLNVVTAKGRACVDSLCCVESDAVDAVIERIPRREQTAVFRALSVLADALDGCCGGGRCETSSTPIRTDHKESMR
jgi:DNA-binding MarR family transcriptional regulator